MTAVLHTQDRQGRERLTSPPRLVFEAAAALAMSMGIGRFAYTPILPLMHAQAGLSPREGSALAVANYIGYLAGAILTTLVPGLARSRSALRAGLLVVIASVALMASTESQAAWLTLRLAAGVASAVVFIIAASAMLTRLRGHSQQLAGWGFGGAGAGIALSGGVVLIAATIRNLADSLAGISGRCSRADGPRLAASARAGRRPGTATESGWQHGVATCVRDVVRELHP